jgi:ribosome maturation factor RimP
MEIREQVIAVVEPLVGERGAELVDVEVRHEGHGRVVRVLVDRQGGIDLDSLSQISREISDHLDVAEPLPGHYTLEVSSPGIDRPLRTPGHFVRYVGKKVRVRSRVPLDDQRNFVGTLETVTADAVTIRREGGGESTIQFSNIEKANYEHEFSAVDFGKRAVPR